MAQSSFVPRPQGTAIVCPPLDTALHESRVNLTATITSEDASADELAQAWTRHESIAVHINRLYAGMIAAHRKSEVDVSACMTSFNAWLKKLLDDPDSPLSKACREFELIETPLMDLSRAMRSGTPLHDTDCGKKIDRAFAGMIAACKSTGEECIATVVSKSVMCAGLPHLHSPLFASIPAELRARLAEFADESILGTKAWHQFASTALGRRMGFLARYAYAGDTPISRAPLCEQLFTDPVYSLLDPTIHHRLTQSAYERPNAKLDAPQQLPLPAILFCLSVYQPWVDADIVNAIETAYNAEQISAIMQRRCSMLREQQASKMDAQQRLLLMMQSFFALSSAFVCLSRQLADEPWNPDMMISVAPKKRALCVMVNLLWHARKDVSIARVLGMLMFWMRYAIRTNIDDTTFSLWSFRESLLLDDLHAFSVQGGFLSASRWVFKCN